MLGLKPSFQLLLENLESTLNKNNNSSAKNEKSGYNLFRNALIGELYGTT
jgi:hypothetical protein